MAKSLFERIIQGDENNFKGDVIFLYSLKEKDKEKKIFSYYATNSKENYIKKAGQEKFDELEKIIKSENPKYVENNFSKFYITAIDYLQVKDNQGLDIIDLGEYNNERDCEFAIMDGLAEYQEKYIQGILQKQKAFFENPIRFNQDSSNFLSDLTPSERKRYAQVCHLVEQMTGAMIYSREEDSFNYRQLKSQLKKLDSSQNYQEDIEKILYLLDNGDLSADSTFFISAAIKDLSINHKPKKNKNRFEFEE